MDAHLIEGRTREVALKVEPGQNSTNGKWFEIQTDAKYVVILGNFPLSIINNCNETIEDSEQALTKLRAEFNQTLAVVYIRETLF